MNLKLVLFLFFILPLVACPLWGQVVQKKQLTESDYSKWGELITEKASANGQWTSYRMLYENEKDTLFLRNTINQKTYNFAGGIFPSFAGNDYFICKDGQNLQILNLKTGKLNSYSNSTQFDYSVATNQIILYSKNDHALQLINLKTSTIKTVHNIGSFYMDPTGKEAIISISANEKSSIGLLNLNDSSIIKWILKDKSHSFYNVTWEEKGKAVAFYSSTKADNFSDASVYLYVLATQKISELSAKTHSFPSDKVLDKDFTYPLTISSDLNRVFFGLFPKNRSIEHKVTDTVEVWNTADKWIYPLEQKSGRFHEKAILALWQPASDTIIQVTSAELPKVMLTGNKACGIVSNPKEYEPQFEIEAPRDYYIINLDTGERELLLKKQNEFYSDLLPSPSGKYIAYYRDNNWWIYDVKLKTHINITEKIPFPFFGKVYILAADSAYGNAGWSSNDQEILLYDQYDIWTIKPDGTSPKRLTQGREREIKFRINTWGDYDLLQENFDGWKSVTTDLSEGLILRAEGSDGKTGYYSWDKINGTKQIVYAASSIDKMQYIKKQQLYIYQQQRFDLPPQLILRKNKFRENVVFQSNDHYQKYQWGTSELIHYQTSKGKKMQGVLYYPSNYNAEEKYPMIVYIYEKKSTTLHRYVNPSLFVGDGFNISAMTSKGYFVLCPDIEHEKGMVGENTVDCTVSAANYVIKRNIIDPKRIGLIGHSFGGYESNFIITQTDLFAAAVAGASITDLNSFYFNVGWDLSISDMSRFQSQQWRMGKTPFEDPELYAKNSPVSNAPNIKTPVLIWTGKADYHVNWNQSVEFYMALRRLHKTSSMLLYPDEKHVLMKQNNQKNLSHRINQWFDYYLKNDKSITWITKNIE